MTLPATVGTGIFPRLPFYVEIFRFLPDVLARRDIFERSRPLLKLVGRRKEVRERQRSPDLGTRNILFLRRKSASALIVTHGTTDRAFHGG